ncbi:glutathione S-transferase A-like isoform X1 [Mytilus californianus]|uniref:glutathione S-transferase A-like isoform X1 n=1 Tax=Mytilus californianus TaxID=6549 RepID=UPI002245B82B|nr:glutathione S-transferase A-like isoform X1 [Mytilus californianus]
MSRISIRFLILPYRSLNTSVLSRKNRHTMAENMFLYWGSGSVPCWKAMIALEEKGFSGYKNKLISFDNNEMKGGDVLKLNPRGEVPTFTDGEVVVNESGAICEYLESTYKDKGTQLIPSGTKQRALVLQRMNEAVANLMHKMLLDYLYEFMETKEEDMNPDTLARKTQTLKDELNRWNDYLGQTGAYLTGPDFTMADVYFFPFIGFGVRLGLNLNSFPKIKSYYERLSSRPSIKATWPPHWKESPGSFKPLTGKM